MKVFDFGQYVTCTNLNTTKLKGVYMVLNMVNLDCIKMTE